MNKKCVVCGKEFTGTSSSKYCSNECRNAKIETSEHVGEKHYELEIIGAYRKKSRLYARCKCSCGNMCVVRYDCLLSGNTKSCGHLEEENYIKPLNLTGKTNQYGVRAIRKLNEKKGSSFVWECKCTCGTIFKIRADNFEKIKSCGCKKSDQAKEHMNEIQKENENYYVDGTSVYGIIDKKMLKNNTSGFRGVTYDKSREKWLAQIVFKGQHYYLGRYDEKKDAVEARRIAEKKIYGNFLEWYAETYPERWKKIQKK